MGSIIDYAKTAAIGAFMASFASLHAVGSTHIANASGEIFVGGFGSLLTP